MSLSILDMKPSVLFGAGEPLRQLAYLSIRKHTPGEEQAAIRIGIEGDKVSYTERVTIREGDQTLHVWVPDIAAPVQLHVSVEVDGKQANSAVWQGEW